MNEEKQIEGFKSCPFCGSNEIDVVDGPTEYDGRRYYDTVYVECQECYMRGPSIDSSENDIINTVIELWNRRAGNG